MLAVNWIKFILWSENTANLASNRIGSYEHTVRRMGTLCHSAVGPALVVSSIFQKHLFSSKNMQIIQVLVPKFMELKSCD